MMSGMSTRILLSPWCCSVLPHTICSSANNSAPAYLPAPNQQGVLVVQQIAAALWSAQSVSA